MITKFTNHCKHDVLDVVPHEKYDIVKYDDSLGEMYCVRYGNDRSDYVVLSKDALPVWLEDNR